MASPEAETATSGLWCDPPAAFTVTSYALVVVPVNPAALTVAGALPWMSSHTTENATAAVRRRAVGVDRRPAGGSAARPRWRWPARSRGPCRSGTRPGRGCCRSRCRPGPRPRPRPRCPCRPGRRRAARAARSPPTCRRPRASSRTPRRRCGTGAGRSRCARCRPGWSVSRSSSHTTATSPMRLAATAALSWSPVATLLAATQLSARRRGGRGAATTATRGERHGEVFAMDPRHG